MMTDNILTINLDEKYKIKIDKHEEIEKGLFFYDVYERATKCVGDIVKASDDDNEKDTENEYGVFVKEKKEFNNIIAFSGARGTGKTSAMVSFANLLREVEGVSKLKLEFKNIELEGVSFNSLRVIDPSLFEKNENIFEVIVSELFAKFKEKLEDKKSEYDFDAKKKLLKLFQEVYQNIQTLRLDGKLYEGEALETLNKLAKGARLRNATIDLISEYLQFMKSGDNLVIPIDDFDLNVKAATDMAEEIRKYLMIPKVVILMAVNIDQLANVKEQSLRKEFRTMIDAGRLFEDTKEMSLRYLLKLIPEERRISLPDIKILGKDVKIRFSNVKHNPDYNNKIQALKKYLFKDYIDDNDFIHIIKLSEGLKDDMSLFSKLNRENAKDKLKEYVDAAESSLSIEDYILKVIYNKTGLIFLKKDYELHRFVPNTLRELREFIFFLKSLGNKVEDKKQNLIDFRTYFLNVFCKDKLDTNFYSIIDDVVSLPTVKWNKYIITKTIDLIRDVESKKFKFPLESMKSEDILKWKGIFSDLMQIIADKDNYSVNVSMGDLLFFINQLKRIDDENISQFAFCLESLYSIQLLYLLRESSLKHSNGKSGYHSLNSLYKIIGGQIIPSVKDSNIENVLGEDKYKTFFDIIPFKKGKYSRQQKIVKYQDATISGVKIRILVREYNIAYDILLKEYMNEASKFRLIIEAYKRREFIDKIQVEVDDVYNEMESLFSKNNVSFLTVNINIEKLKNNANFNEIFVFVEIEQIILFHMFLAYQGRSNFDKKRLKDECRYEGNINIGSANVSNEALFDIFTIFSSSIYPEKIWERIFGVKFNGESQLIRELISQRENCNILFPIYSIDLINKIFIKDKFVGRLYFSEHLGEYCKTVIDVSIDSVKGLYPEYPLENFFDDLSINSDLVINNIFVNSLPEINESFIKLGMEYRKAIYNLYKAQTKRLNSFNTGINEISRIIKNFNDTNKLSYGLIETKYLSSINKKLDSLKFTEEDIDPKSETNKRITSDLEKQMDSTGQSTDNNRSKLIFEQKIKLIEIDKQLNTVLSGHLSDFYFESIQNCYLRLLVILDSEFYSEKKLKDDIQWLLKPLDMQNNLDDYTIEERDSLNSLKNSISIEKEYNETILLNKQNEFSELSKKLIDILKKYE